MQNASQEINDIDSNLQSSINHMKIFSEKKALQSISDIKFSKTPSLQSKILDSNSK